MSNRLLERQKYRQQDWSQSNIHYILCNVDILFIYIYTVYSLMMSNVEVLLKRCFWLVLVFTKAKKHRLFLRPERRWNSMTTMIVFCGCPGSSAAENFPDAEFMLLVRFSIVFFWHFRWFHGKFHDHFSFVVPHHAIVWSEFISFIFICDLLHLFATSAAAGIWLCNCCGGIAATQRLCGFNVWFPMALKCLFFDLMWLLI